MATGDFSNNVKKLKGKLRAVRYHEDIDITQLADGSPSVYLPVYHYAFTSYSAGLAETILSKGIELYGKSDARFMEAIYKILRDMFSYKPPVTKEQFFSRSFAERKVIMCCDILQLVKVKAAELNPAPAKTALKMSVRPKSAEPKNSTAEPPVAVPKTKRVSSSRLALRPEAGDSQCQLSPRQPPQVINELVSSRPGQPVRHVATHGQRYPTAPGAGTTTAGYHSNLARHTAATTTQPPVRHVAMRSPPDDVRYQSEESSPEHLHSVQICENTPSIQRFCQNSVEVVTMPRRTFTSNPSNEEDDIVDINAPTSESILQGPVPYSRNAEHENNITKTLNTLTSQVLAFDSTLKSMQDMCRGSRAEQDPYIQGLEDRIQAQIDNLMARMVLLENRVTIIETKVDVANSSTSTLQSEVSGQPLHVPLTTSHYMPVSMMTSNKQPVTVATGNNVPSSMTTSGSGDFLPPPPPGNEAEMMENTSFAQQLKTLSSTGKRMQSLLSEAHDFSLNYSPIKTTGGRVTGQMMSAMEDTFAGDLESEDDARRSSTPTMGGTFMNESSICCNFTDGETQDRVSRIKSMLRETKGLLHENIGDVKSVDNSNS